MEGNESASPPKAKGRSSRSKSVPAATAVPTPSTPAAQSQSARGGGGGGSYEVARALGKCVVTGQTLSPGDKFHAALRETDTGLERLDVSLPAWPDFPRDRLLATWLATMPATEAKKKVFVDDEVLLTLFERLQDTAEPAKLRFRFVLGLILMRKRLVQYDSEVTDSAGGSVWRVRLKGREHPLDLVNPHLSEEQVGDVAGQLNEILATDL